MKKSMIVVIAALLAIGGVVAHYVTSPADETKQRVQQELRDHQAKCKANPQLFECQEAGA